MMDPGLGQSSSGRPKWDGWTWFGLASLCLVGFASSRNGVSKRDEGCL